MTTRTGLGRPVVTWSVRVLLRRREIERGGWTAAHWELLGVFPVTARADAVARRLVHHGDASWDFEWSGLSLPLFRDAAESYWYNLVGREPSIFVVGRPGEDIDLEPVAVTVNYDEAGAYMESDDTVLAAPLPDWLGPSLEEFVMNHYRPEPPRKRKRRDWAAEATHGGQGSEGEP